MGKLKNNMKVGKISFLILCLAIGLFSCKKDDDSDEIITIKPLDDKAILDSVAKTGCIVTAEEHNILGGLGESVARVLATNNPTPQEFVGTNDTFGESGTPAQLMDKYGLNSATIVEKALAVIKRK